MSPQHQRRKTRSEMKSSSIKKHAIYLAMVCAVLACVPSAHAVPANQVLRNLNNQVFTGFCCVDWNETVSIVEPTTVVPVVVTWSADFHLQSLVFIQAGISTNFGPCQSGPGRFEQPLSAQDQFDTRTVQFIIEPAQGLHSGTNTFSLCGGGLFSATDSITI